MFFIIQIILAIFGIFLLLVKKLRVGEQEIASPIAPIIGAVLVVPLMLGCWLTISYELPAAYNSGWRAINGQDVTTQANPYWWVDPVSTCLCVMAAGGLGIIALRNNDPLAGAESKFNHVPLQDALDGYSRPQAAMPSAPPVLSKAASSLARQLFATSNIGSEAVMESDYDTESRRRSTYDEEEVANDDPPLAMSFEMPLAPTPEPTPAAPEAKHNDLASKYPSLPAALPALVQQMQMQSRTYFHPICGGYTTVDGEQFKMLDNPFREVEETYCCGCGRMVSLSLVQWADSGETIMKCRKRIADSTPFWEQMKRTMFG